MDANHTKTEQENQRVSQLIDDYKFNKKGQNVQIDNELFKLKLTDGSTIKFFGYNDCNSYGKTIEHIDANGKKLDEKLLVHFSNGRFTRRYYKQANCNDDLDRAVVDVLIQGQSVGYEFFLLPDGTYLIWSEKSLPTLIRCYGFLQSPYFQQTDEWHLLDPEPIVSLHEKAYVSVRSDAAHTEAALETADRVVSVFLRWYLKDRQINTNNQLNP